MRSIFETMAELPVLVSLLVQFKQPQDASNAVVVITTTSVQKCTSVPGLWGNGNAYMRQSFQASTKFAAARTRAETKDVYTLAKALSTNW
jgi:hypothetical protein